MPDSSPFTWFSATLSHVGNKRKVNEDRYLAHGDAGLWAVADGMGGYEAGDVAAQAIVDALQAIVTPSRMSEFVDSVEQRLLEANAHIYQQSQAAERISGSTVVVLLALDYHCALMWAGDSRAYRYRNGQLQQLMQDHSEARELLAQGLLTPEQAATYDDNTITRAIGAEPAIALEMALYPIHHDDVYLLCSDGLYREITEDEITEIIGKERDCEKAAKALLDLALSREAKDNITLIIMRARGDAKSGQLLTETEQGLLALSQAYYHGEADWESYRQKRAVLIDEKTAMDKADLVFPIIKAPPQDITKPKAKPDAANKQPTESEQPEQASADTLSAKMKVFYWLLVLGLSVVLGLVLALYRNVE